MKNCKFYDLCGYMPGAPKDTVLYGINHFKEGFSKEFVMLVRGHERIFSPTCYRLFSWLNKTKDKAMSAKDRFFSKALHSVAKGPQLNGLALSPVVSLSNHVEGSYRSKRSTKTLLKNTMLQDFSRA